MALYAFDATARHRSTGTGSPRTSHNDPTGALRRIDDAGMIS